MCSFCMQSIYKVSTKNGDFIQRMQVTCTFLEYNSFPIHYVVWIRRVCFNIALKVCILTMVIVLLNRWIRSKESFHKFSFRLKAFQNIFHTFYVLVNFIRLVKYVWWSTITWSTFYSFRFFQLSINGMCNFYKIAKIFICTEYYKPEIYCYLFLFIFGIIRRKMLRIRAKYEKSRRCNYEKKKIF